MTQTFSPEVIEALAELRETARLNLAEIRVVAAFNVLDDAGVFAALDEQTGYAAAVDVLAEAAGARLDAEAGGPLDPAEWGDLSRTDIARRSSVGSQADRTAHHLF